MTLIKSILLGSAAGIVAVAGAQAADLPTKKAAPAADYVKICNVNGTAGFIVPGSDTCLKLFGDVKFEVIGGSTNTGYTYGRLYGTTLGVPNPRNTTFLTQTVNPTNTRDNLELGAREDLGFTASSNTAYGPLVAEAQFEGNQRNAGGGGVTTLPGTFGAGFAMDHAFIKWAGITAGDVGSYYDLGNGPGDLDYFSPDPGTVPTLAYTAAFGGGFSATVFVQDGVGKRTNGSFVLAPDATALAANPLAPSFTFNNTYHGVQYPDVGAELEVVQGWGAAKIAAMAHNTNVIAGGYGDSTNFWGYGVNGLLQINLPALGPKSEFTVQGAYSHGALALGGVTAPGVIPFNGNGANFLFTDAYDTAGGGFIEPTSWSVASHLTWVLSPQFSISPEISYGQIDYGSGAAFIPQKLTAWMGGAIAHWDPVTNLDFQLDAIYVSAKETRPTALLPGTPWQTKSDGFFGRLAIARTF